MFIYLWERDRERQRLSMGGRRAEREGDTESEAGSRLRPSCQHRARCGARTHELQDCDLSRSRTLNWLSPPAPCKLHFGYREAENWVSCTTCLQVTAGSAADFQRTFSAFSTVRALVDCLLCPGTTDLPRAWSTSCLSALLLRGVSTSSNWESRLPADPD